MTTPSSSSSSLWSSGKWNPFGSSSSSSSTRGGSSGGSTPSSWLDWKDRGNGYYRDGRYEEALRCYGECLRPENECPPNSSDYQKVLSNMVACRLRIGGGDGDGGGDANNNRGQLELAVEDAKRCVEIDPGWSKAHVRLASAYIALGDHSNDACNALQTAIRLDPDHSQSAREMLRDELRSRSGNNTAAAAADEDRKDLGNGNDDDRDFDRFRPAAAAALYDDDDDDIRRAAVPAAPSAPPMEEDDDRQRERQPAGNPNYVPPTPPVPPPPPHDDMDIDESTSASWSERLSDARRGALRWYSNLSDDRKTGAHLVLSLLVLYVAMGGRFGLVRDDGGGAGTSDRSGRTKKTPSPSGGGGKPAERGEPNWWESWNDPTESGGSSSSRSKQKRSAKETANTAGNYGPDNAYEQFRRQREQRFSNVGGGGGYSNGYNNNEEDDAYGSYNGGTNGGGGGGGGKTGAGYDSGALTNDLVPFLTIFLVAAFVYICHLAGINVFQALWMLAVLTGRRRNRRAYRNNYYPNAGGGYGYGGGRGGYYRQRRRW